MSRATLIVCSILLSGCSAIAAKPNTIIEKSFSRDEVQGIVAEYSALSKSKKECVEGFLETQRLKAMEYCEKNKLGENIGGGCGHLSRTRPIWDYHNGLVVCDAKTAHVSKPLQLTPDQSALERSHGFKIFERGIGDKAGKYVIVEQADLRLSAVDFVNLVDELENLQIVTFGLPIQPPSRISRCVSENSSFIEVHDYREIATDWNKLDEATINSMLGLRGWMLNYRLYKGTPGNISIVLLVEEIRN